MGGILQLTQGLLDSTNAFNSAWRKQLEHEAEFSTMSKQIFLQTEINNKLLSIRQNNNFDSWNNEINNLFEGIKKDMSTPGSKFYCRNQLEGEKFNQILAEAHTTMSYQVAQMAIKKQSEKRVVDADESKQEMINQGVTGNEYIKRADELDNMLDGFGDLNPGEVKARKDNNRNTGYTTLYNNLFEEGYKEAIRNGEDLSTYLNKIEQETEKVNDGSITQKTKDDARQKAEITWNATLRDIQQKNADELEQIAQKIKFAKSEEEIVNYIAQGQDFMKNMKVNDLSMSDKRHYSDVFESYRKALSDTGAGNGNNKESDSYAKLEALIAVDGATVIEMVKRGEVINYYDGINDLKYVMYKEFMNGKYSESAKIKEENREDLWKSQYAGQVSEDKMITAVKNELIKLYPEMGPLIAGNFEKLKADMDANPRKYGSAALQDLSNWLIDTMMGSNGKLDDKTFKAMFDKHINDFYIEKTKYLELNSEGKPKKTFDSTKPQDVMEAAKLSQNDYVYTWKNTERWAPGKQKALEAEGGVIQTLRSAVAQYLDVPEKEIRWQYKTDEEHNDKTSTPIFTYNNRTYEVLPDEKGNRFYVLRIMIQVRLFRLIQTKPKKRKRHKKKPVNRKSWKQNSRRNLLHRIPLKLNRKDWKKQTAE